MKNLPLGFALLSLLFITPFVVKAQDKPAGNPIFTLQTTNDYWEENYAPGVEMTSLQPIGGSTWSTKAFIHSKDHYGLLCGLRDVPYVATIKNNSPLPAAIGIVSAYLSYKDHRDCLNSVILRISENSDFANYQDIELPIQKEGASYWNFSIPEPKENLYYQLRIDFEPVENNWIELTRIDFYAPDTNVGTVDIATNDISRETVWYNIQGQEVTNPTAGVYLRKNGNRITKVIMK